MKQVSLIIFIFCIVVLSASEAYSCTCAGTSQHSAFRKSHAVFVGKFVEYGEAPKDKESPFPIKFKIEKMWRGKIKPEIIIYTFDLGLSACGEGFVLGQRYLIYAYGNKLVAHLVCGPSHKIIMDNKYTDYKDQEKELGNLDSISFRLFARLWPLG